jgi:hypothetical protein
MLLGCFELLTPFFDRVSSAGECAQGRRHVGQIAQLEAHITGMTGRGRPDVGVAQRVRSRAIPAGALAEYAAPHGTRRTRSAALLPTAISCSRKPSQAPVEAELIYWLPPSRVKQSGKATTTGSMRCCPINRSSRSGRFSPKTDAVRMGEAAAGGATRSTSRGNPCPLCPAGTSHRRRAPTDRPA